MKCLSFNECVQGCCRWRSITACLSYSSRNVTRPQRQGQSGRAGAIPWTALSVPYYIYLSYGYIYAYLGACVTSLSRYTHTHTHTHSHTHTKTHKDTIGMYLIIPSARTHARARTHTHTHSPTYTRAHTHRTQNTFKLRTNICVHVYTRIMESRERLLTFGQSRGVHIRGPGR
jgi:hypothetical protein